MPRSHHLVLFVATVLLHAIAATDGDLEGVEEQGRELFVPATPLHSIVFVTKRPGGYDVIMESLARQTNRNYELICVDELADHRAHAVKEMAAQLQVNLVAITRSKPKTHPETRFGIANAINTGFVLAKGHIVTVLQDNIYLPNIFVEKTLRFHADNPNALVSYPEMRFIAPPSHVDINLLHDPSSTSVFVEPVTEGPQEQGWRLNNEGTQPQEVWNNMREGARRQFDWLECACCSLPYSVMRELNGVDETLDTGDDCHEVNLRDRAKMIEHQTWNEGACPVQLIDHHRWDRSEVWTRFTRDTNIFRWDFMRQQMEFGDPLPHELHAPYPTTQHPIPHT
jgi:glycosyltransferase involved in cell wall biosynthesis